MNKIKYEVTKTVEMDIVGYATDALDTIEDRLRDNIGDNYGNDIADDIYNVAIMDVYRAIIKQAEEKLAENEEFLNGRVADSNVKKITEEED